MPTGVGTIDVSDCSVSANNGQYTVSNNGDGTWSFTGQPSGAYSPVFQQDSDSGPWIFKVRNSIGQTCIFASWNSLPSGSPDSILGLCTGSQVSASGF